MALRVVRLNHTPQRERRLEAAPVIKLCPVCEGEMELVYNRNSQQVIVCKDCHSGLTVPAGAWNVLRVKREAKWVPKR